MGIPDIAEALMSVFNVHTSIFLLSLASNSIPFVSIPYLGVVAGYSIIYRDLPSRVSIILLSALGASLGKVLIYFIGRAFRVKLGDVSKSNVELFKKVARKSLFFAVLVFAATPLPDDVIYIPIGIMKYPLTHYFTAVLLGKTVLTSTVALYASWMAYIAEVNLLVIPALVAVTFLLSYLVIRINWASVINAFYDKGLRGSIKVFTAEVSRVLTPAARKPKAAP